MSESGATLGIASDAGGPMRRWLVKVKSKRGLALRDVFIVARDERSARDRVQQMYLLSDIEMICPSAEDARSTQTLSQRR